MLAVSTETGQDYVQLVLKASAVALPGQAFRSLFGRFTGVVVAGKWLFSLGLFDAPSV